MAQTLQKQILAEGRRFAKRRRISLATLSNLALGQARFFTRLEARNDCSLLAWQKMMAYIDCENARLDAEKEAKRNG